jgi:SpoVK/Ycf46/Vps4 family AAA+-type ATPase
VKQDTAIQDIVALLRAKNTLLWVTSGEEVRVERALLTAAQSFKQPWDLRFWDCIKGVQDAEGKPVDASLVDPLKALASIEAKKERCIYVFRDLHVWMDKQTVRALRSLARALQSAPPGEARAVIVLSPSTDIPLELQGAAQPVDWPLPDRDEMGDILDYVVNSSPVPPEEALAEGTRSAAVDAALGLSAEEAMNSYSRSLVTERRIDPAIVAAEKKRIIAKSGVLTWYDPDPRGLDSIGGLDLLKEWLIDRQDDLTPEAREYGLQAPRGVFLIGPPGTGKSQTAKAIATAWGLPLLRADAGGLKSKYVGDSEQNARKMFQTADTVAPCVLWFDEIDKALAGSTGPQGDGGVSSDFLGTFLSWMQDRLGAVFVVATANDIKSLPSALLRSGRFDGLFFVDLPTTIERKQVLAVSLRKAKRDPDVILKDRKTNELITITEGFSGAEIDALIPDALHRSFKDGRREVTVSDLLTSAKLVVPLSKTANDIGELREWAKTRTRPASTPEVVKAGGARAIEM